MDKPIRIRYVGSEQNDLEDIIYEQTKRNNKIVDIINETLKENDIDIIRKKLNQILFLLSNQLFFMDGIKIYKKYVQ